MMNKKQAPTPVAGLTTALMDRGFGGPAAAMAAFTPQETLPFTEPSGVPTVSPKGGAKGVPYGHIGNPEDGRVVHGMKCAYNGCSFVAKDSHGLAEHKATHRRSRR